MPVRAEIMGQCFLNFFEKGVSRLTVYIERGNRHKVKWEQTHSAIQYIHVYIETQHRGYEMT